MKVNIGGEKLTMAELAHICGGMLCCIGGENNTDIPFESVCTDSRETGAGALFVALDGERVDGHDYIDAALSYGTGCVLCERIPDRLTDRKYAAVVVDDSLKAVGELAKAYDRKINHRKVAVTGSVGKTTTKEFIAAVLSEKLKVHKTEGNFNSNIGMPLSMLSMTHDTEVSVLEMGMSARGEIDYLSRLAEPDIAVITTIGSSHIGHLGSRENICRAKLEIVNGLKEGGLLLLNGDEPLLRAYKNQSVDIVYVGVDNDADFKAENIRNGFMSTTFDIRYDSHLVRDITIPTMGNHNVYAALFAYAVGIRMGLNSETIISGLCNFKPVGMRQNVYSIGDITVIEDCYNASPESMRAAIGVLSDLATGRESGRMCALLGDMYELGEETEKLHENVGEAFVNAGGNLLFTFGNYSDGIARGAILHGLPAENVYRNNDVKKVSVSGEMLLYSLRPGDVLLVKASRGAAAERVIEYLKENSDRLCR